MRDPDSQFKHENAKFPGVVIEVAFSQSQKDGGKDLGKLAEQYIVESSGNIKTVLGISVAYGSTKKAMISTWSPKHGTDEEGAYLAAEETLASKVRRSTPSDPP